MAHNQTTHQDPSTLTLMDPIVLLLELEEGRNWRQRSIMGSRFRTPAESATVLHPSSDWFLLETSGTGGYEDGKVGSGPLTKMSASTTYEDLVRRTQARADIAGLGRLLPLRNIGHVKLHDAWWPRVTRKADSMGELGDVDFEEADRGEIDGKQLPLYLMHWKVYDVDTPPTGTAVSLPVGVVGTPALVSTQESPEESSELAAQQAVVRSPAPVPQTLYQRLEGISRDAFEARVCQNPSFPLPTAAFNTSAPTTLASDPPEEYSGPAVVLAPAPAPAPRWQTFLTDFAKRCHQDVPGPEALEQPSEDTQPGHPQAAMLEVPPAATPDNGIAPAPTAPVPGTTTAVLDWSHQAIIDRVLGAAAPSSNDSNTHIPLSPAPVPEIGVALVDEEGGVAATTQAVAEEVARALTPTSVSPSRVGGLGLGLCGSNPETQMRVMTAAPTYTIWMPVRPRVDTVIVDQPPVEESAHHTTAPSVESHDAADSEGTAAPPRVSTGSANSDRKQVLLTALERGRELLDESNFRVMEATVRKALLALG